MCVRKTDRLGGIPHVEQFIVGINSSLLFSSQHKLSGCRDFIRASHFENITWMDYFDAQFALGSPPVSISTLTLWTLTLPTRPFLPADRR